MSSINYSEILDVLFDGVYYVDRDRRIQLWNKGAERITGYSSEEICGSFCHENVLRHIDDQGCELCLGHCPLHETISDGNFRECRIHLHHKLGHRVPVTVRVSPLRDQNGEIIGAVEIFSDNSTAISILKELELLKQEAYLDPLTCVGNRRFAQATLNTRIFEYSTRNVPFGVIFLDIDRFKNFNDTYGHKIGDDVLIMVGKTIAGLLRRSDMVARWGGEEFVVILANTTEKTLRVIADRIRVFIENSFIMNKAAKLCVTASLGATLAVEGDTAEEIVKRADRLMYASKANGRNCVTFG